MMTGNYEIRIGKCLQSAWNTFLKAPDVFVLLTLGSIAVSFFFSWLPGLGTLLNLTLVAGILPAYFLLAEQIRREGEANFSTLKALLPMAPQLLMVALLKSIFIGLGLMLFVIPGLYAILIYCFSEALVCFEKKTFWEAMETSRKIVHLNWSAVATLIFFCFLLILAGALLLGVGLLAAIPITALVLHAAFHEVRSHLPPEPN